LIEKSNRHDNYLRLRDEFAFFSYEGYDYSYSGHGLDIRFYFNLADRYHFSPTIFVPHKEFFIPEEELMELLPSLVFHLGMIELISYWKAACPKQLIIKPHALSPEQIAWWKKCWFNGLSEFFFLNGISTDIDAFTEVTASSGEQLPPVSCRLEPDVIVPVGGGKDSIVTLELLRKLPGITPMIINPRGASVHGIFMAGFAHSGMIGIHRTIDPLLLQLNDEGFLNGHTPFSALIAFVGILAAILSGKRYIALSNESSANETTIPGMTVNHQYSKTFEFEQDFRAYVKQWICPEIDYFSFLRPLNELQIASVFSRFPVYFPVFKSCNVGGKTDSWCGKCPKCLFTYIILSPFLKPGQLIDIFRKNLFEDLSLAPILDQLTGILPEKPFECVGTISEVNAALQETIKNYGTNPLPKLLAYYHQITTAPRHHGTTAPRHHGTTAPRHHTTTSPPHHGTAFSSLLHDWNPQNALPPRFEQLLKGALHD